MDLLVDKQYGSRRNKAAVLQCLNKGIFYLLPPDKPFPASIWL